MPLILAIEPDRRQAAQLSVVVRKRVHAELILVDTTERALDAIGNRMPDLVLVPALLSPQDDAALAAALRVIAAAACVQMLTIPVLGTPRPAPSPGGVLSALRRGKPRAAEPDGCDPAVFAEQIASYLERVAQERPSTAAVAPADLHPPVDDAPVETMAAFDDATGTVEDATFDGATGTVENALRQEWLESLPAEEDVVVEPVSAAVPDESVSFALEEAVRALFADPAPAAVDPAPAAVDPAPAAVDPEPVAVFAMSQRPVAAAAPTEKDEWVAVDELMAALQVMPLSAIEVTDEDEWIGPLLNEPRRVVETHEIDDAERGDIDLTKELKAPGGKSEREWVALIESLRHDVERLRVERSDKPGRKPAAAQAPRPDRKPKPVQDEWGFFDPEQCGFAALLAKLDEVTESEDSPVKP
jgi:hypothetical protein